MRNVMRLHELIIPRTIPTIREVFVGFGDGFEELKTSVEAKSVQMSNDLSKEERRQWINKMLQL